MTFVQLLWQQLLYHQAALHWKWSYKGLWCSILSFPSSFFAFSSHSAFTGVVMSNRQVGIIVYIYSNPYDRVTGIQPNLDRSFPLGSIWQTSSLKYQHSAKAALLENYELWMYSDLSSFVPWRATFTNFSKVAIWPLLKTKIHQLNQPQKHKFMDSVWFNKIITLTGHINNPIMEKHTQI